jgi:hypothetical protein
MTFIDNSGDVPTPAFISLYAITAVLYLFCAFYSFYRSNTHRHYSSLCSIRILFPLANLSCAIENITLAASGKIIENELDSHELLKVVFVLHALQVPIFLITIFELTYLVHKRRSVHFCGMFFDEGRLVLGRLRANANVDTDTDAPTDIQFRPRLHGVFSTPVKSFFFRNIIRFIAILCWIIGTLANLDLLRDGDPEDELAGRTGWWNLWETKGNRVWTVHILMSLVPTAVLLVCSFFLSITLWRYGANSSIVLHSSYACLNPWFFPMFGTVALWIGQLFYPKFYSITSNIGLLVYTLSILVLMKEIDKEVTRTVEFTDFLKQVAKKGNEISVMNDIDVDGDANDKLKIKGGGGGDDDVWPGKIGDHNQRVLVDIDQHEDIVIV